MLSHNLHTQSQICALYRLSLFDTLLRILSCKAETDSPNTQRPKTPTHYNPYASVLWLPSTNDSIMGSADPKP